MATTNTATGGTLATRPGASRKLLTRKTSERAADAMPQGDPLEASFPTTTLPLETPAAPVIGQVELADRSLARPDHDPAPALPRAELATSAPAWSTADESAYKAMQMRRRAAGYERRGRDVSCELLGVGTIVPNPGTAVAVIVSIVAERGAITRGDLLEAMGAATFLHAKARPHDRAWCTGYVAGAKRDGFLVVVNASGDNARGGEQ